MSDKHHHRAHRGTRRLSLCPPCLRALCVKRSLVLILAALFTSSIAAQNQSRQPLPPEKRTRYQIHLVLDFENRTYSGTERVRWINRGNHPTSTLFFHLYSNLRMPGYAPPTEKAQSGQQAS